MHEDCSQNECVAQQFPDLSGIGAPLAETPPAETPPVGQPSRLTPCFNEAACLLRLRRR